VIFLVLLALFILLMVWLLPKIWRGIKRVFAWFGRLFGGGKRLGVDAAGRTGKPDNPP
jgi:hypothetical protein